MSCSVGSDSVTIQVSAGQTIVCECCAAKSRSVPSSLLRSFPLCSLPLTSCTSPTAFPLRVHLEQLHDYQALRVQLNDLSLLLFKLVSCGLPCLFVLELHVCHSPRVIRCSRFLISHPLQYFVNFVQSRFVATCRPHQRCAPILILSGGFGGLRFAGSLPSPEACCCSPSSHAPLTTLRTCRLPPFIFLNGSITIPCNIRSNTFLLGYLSDQLLLSRSIRLSFVFWEDVRGLIELETKWQDSLEIVSLISHSVGRSMVVPDLCSGAGDRVPR